MGTLIRLVIVALMIAWPTHDYARDTHVRGYTKKDGTYVAPHMRSAPDGNPYNNWSTKGNINPYTGQAGTKSVPGSSIFNEPAGPPNPGATQPSIETKISPSKADTETKRNLIPRIAVFTQEDLALMETACGVTKYGGSIAYNWCFHDQMKALMNLPLKPDLSKQSPEVVQWLETTCRSAKIRGAGPYHACLDSQLNRAEYR